jgi:hypothetical protein
MSRVTMTSLYADKGTHYPDDGAGAIYSEDARYRFSLWRIWDRSRPIVLFIMLNPSTATHLELDPTLRRCRGYAKEWGYGGFEVANLFAFRATEPEDMKAAADPIGEENDDGILARAKEVIRAGGIVICGWGNHGTYRNRCYDFRGLLRRHDVKMHYLKLSKDGFPGHPLYLKAGLKPQEWV